MTRPNLIVALLLSAAVAGVVPPAVAKARAAAAANRVVRGGPGTAGLSPAAASHFSSIR
jgi:hypothetical protein